MCTGVASAYTGAYGTEWTNTWDAWIGVWEIPDAELMDLKISAVASRHDN